MKLSISCKNFKFISFTELPLCTFLYHRFFCVTWFKQFLSFPLYLELYVPCEMVKMLSLMQLTHVSDGWNNSRHPSGFGGGGNGNPPPPPPPVGIAEVLAAQTEILQQLVQAQQQPQGGHHAHQAQEVSYQDFLSTQPHCSLKRMSLLTQTLGFTQSSPSFLYWLLLVPKWTRLAMPHSNFAD